MNTFLKLIVVCVLVCLTIGCASQPNATTAAPRSSVYQRVRAVRTTAYTHGEEGGGQNAIGTPLRSCNVMSAAADWSYWPLGTKFRIIATDEVFQVDDYGGALTGTRTIDLYKPSRSAMNRWGVRAVDIDILEWGSPDRSLAVLNSRSRIPHVRIMIAALERHRNERPGRLFF